MPSLKAIITHNFPYDFVHEEQEKGSLKWKAATLLSELRSIADTLLNGKNGDYSRIRSDDTLSLKGQQEKIQALHKMRIALMRLTIENSEVQSLITEGRSKLEAEHAEIFDTPQPDRVINFLIGQEIRDFLSTFVKIPKGPSADSQRMDVIEKMFLVNDVDGIRSIFNSPLSVVKPVMDNLELLDSLKDQWIEKQNPGLAARMKDLTALSEMVDQGIGDVRSGMEEAAGMAPTFRERITESNPIEPGRVAAAVA